MIFLVESQRCSSGSPTTSPTADTACAAPAYLQRVDVNCHSDAA